MRLLVSGASLAVALVSVCADAQKPPAIRQIERVARMSTDSLASAATALPMADGRVLVNDTRGRRVLLFDSTLARASVVADTTGATANAYGGGSGTLIRYRGDTALFISPASLSMFVIGPAGTIVRVMAIPRPDEAQSLFGIFGTPGFDARGRLTYFDGLGALPGVLMLARGKPVPKFTGRMAAMMGDGRTDSAVIVRADLETRAVDTVAWIRIPKSRRALKTDAQGLLVAIETTPDPLPLVDAWTMLPDGSLAVVRARDYHVDWLDANGRWTSTPKMPFDWQPVSDARKETLIDSTVKEWQKSFDGVEASRASGGGAGTGRGGGSGRGGGAGAGGGGGGPPGGIAPTVAVRPALSDLPDYMPPLTQMAPQLGKPLHADADGNLWIRTTTMVQGQPVYDIVNRRGELFDRVQLPPFRTIAGFGPGVVYMAMKDAAGIVHIERARVK